MNEDSWVPVKGFPGYSVNPLGQVRNDAYADVGRLLHVRINQYGVPYVGMMRDGRRHQCVRSLPRLVAEAFVSQPNKIFDTPINMDGDRMNCHVNNLAWRPRWYAVYYVNQFAKARYPNPIEAPIRNVETGEEFDNSLHAACHYGVLEREVVLSILNQTLAWPAFQKFELIE